MLNELMRNLLELQTLEFGENQDAKTTAQAAELRGKIPPQVLGHYDRLRIRGKKGVAAVRNRVCTACHMGLPLGVIMTLRHAVDIQLCDGCGRYLYLVEESPEPAAQSLVPAKAVKKPRKRKPASPPA